jgi:hypothetical protein
MEARIKAFLGTPRTTRSASHFAIGDGEVFNEDGGGKGGKGARSPFNIQAAY